MWQGRYSPRAPMDHDEPAAAVTTVCGFLAAAHDGGHRDMPAAGPIALPLAFAVVRQTAGASGDALCVMVTDFRSGWASTVPISAVQDALVRRPPALGAPRGMRPRRSWQGNGSIIC